MTPQTPVQEILEYLDKSIKALEDERNPFWYRAACRIFQMEPRNATIAHELRLVRFLIEKRIGVK